MIEPKFKLDQEVIVEEGTEHAHYYGCFARIIGMHVFEGQVIYTIKCINTGMEDNVSEEDLRPRSKENSKAYCYFKPSTGEYYWLNEIIEEDENRFRAPQFDLGYKKRPKKWRRGPWR